MRGINKSVCLFSLIFLLVITIVALDIPKAYAGGGINYKVTVNNPTDKKFKV